MMYLQLKFISLGKLFLITLLPNLFVAGIWWLSSVNFEWSPFLESWLFIAGVLLIAPICQLGMANNTKIQLQPASIGIMLFTLGIGVLYWSSPNTLIAWLLLGCIYILLLVWVSVFAPGLRLWSRVLLEGVFMITAGLLPALLNQIETRFSTEEFFVALEVGWLMIFWLVLRSAYALWVHEKPQKPYAAKWQIRRGWLLAGLGLAAFAGMTFVGLEYQRSFFSAEAPEFPGISAESPFICGEVPPAQEIYQGIDVFRSLLKQVEANTNNGVPEYALLAIGTQDQHWAIEFRDSILAEAEVGLFTEPVGSVKYGQYLASQRAYFYPLVHDAFPGLFTPSQEQIIGDWFAAINQRAFTVEWVDWMYALAFSYWPQGPYENQESGAGLLSLLEFNQLADPELSEQNQQYLTENPRGWLTRFRVTDDAAVYQPEWMENAWYQALYTQEGNRTNQELSFDWLKVLALPDGSPLRYNHLGAVDYADHAYWGANLLGDETLLWLAGRALVYQAKNMARIGGQPGAESSLDLTGRSPTSGSCLVYGDSGLPTQPGPLAPDKIVMRSGWEPDDLYLLLNLRFTGWHRYKATNAVTQIYKGEPLVIENTSGEIFSWLPIGRSIFRDKRIPRENLNGLQIAKTGLAAVLYQITGFGSPWAQDPPYYAEVVRFETSPELTVSSTQIKDWHGWDHQRTIYFYPAGVVVVIDDAQGPKNIPATLTWNLVSEAIPEGNRFTLGGAAKGSPSEVVLLPSNGSQFDSRNLSPDGDLPIIQIEYRASETSNFQTITVFLVNEWVGADLRIQEQILNINQGDQQMEIPLSDWQAVPVQISR